MLPAGPALHDRERELLALRDALGSAGAGRGAIVVAVAEAGGGKTALLEAFAAQARSAGAAIAWSAALDAEGVPPFWPWIQLLRDLAASGLGATEAALAALAEPSTSTPAPQSRFQLFDLVGRAVAAIARPAVLVIDDLHFASGDTLRLLEFVAPLVRRAPVVLAVATRPPHAGSDLSAALGELTRRGADRFDLRLLGTAAVSAELAAAGAPAEAGVVASVLERTGGNPFYVREVARYLASTPEGGAAVPPAVLDVLQSQIRRLSPAGVDLLRLAAAWGDDAPASILAGDAGIPVASVLAESAGLLVSAGAGAVRFRHALVRDAVYAAMTDGDRQEAHARLASALDASPAPLDAEAALRYLAVHACRAGPRWDAARAVLTATAAGDAAASHLGFESAATFYRLAEEALAWAPSTGGRRLALLLARGEQLTNAGRADLAEPVLHFAAGLARGAGNGVALGRVALLFRLGAESATGADPEISRLLEEALELLPIDEHTLRARLLARLVWQLIGPGQMGRRRELADRALAEAQTGEEPAAIASALLALVFASHSDEPARRLDFAQRAITMATRANDAGQTLGGLLFRTFASLELGDIEDARLAIAAYGATVARYPFPYHAWYVPLLRIMLALLEDRPDEAERLLAAEDPDATPQPGLATLFFVTQAMEIALQRRDPSAVKAALGRLWPIVAGHYATPAFEAHGAATLGDPVAARAALERFIASIPQVEPDEDLGMALGMAARAAVLLGARDLAPVLIDLLAPYSRWLVLGNGAVVAGPFDAILASLHELAGDAPLARALRDRARADIERQRAPGALRLLDEQPAAPERATFPAGLTAREVEVLRLLAEGCSNLEIAASLVLSVRTVQRHIENIYGKLGSRTRAAASAFAVRHGLAAPMAEPGSMRRR